MVRNLTTRLFSEQEIAYDGLQLRPHWLYQRFEILGDGVVSFIGKADLPLEHMVDLEDVKKKAPIYSPKMLHFIGEFFLDSLDQGVLLQGHLVRTAYELLWEKGARYLSRRGDDLFFDNRKLSVSIATRSPVSVLIHFGINIETDSTPIPTSGLKELWVDPAVFAAEVLERFRYDHLNWQKSRCKVSPR